MRPFFSIITPIYNSAPYLDKCIQSIQNQDYDDFEVLLIDDGSTDDSLRIAKQLAQEDKRIKVFSQANQGPSKARNIGLDNATGEWILFVDSDDYYICDDALSSIYKAIQSTNKCELVYFGGAVAIEGGLYYDKLDSKVYNDGVTCMEKYCLDNRSIIFGALYVQCYNRDLIERKKHRFVEDIVYGEDRLFVCSYYLYAKKTVVLPKNLYVYVVNQSSLMRDEKKKRRQFHDNRAVAMLLEKEIVISGENVPYLRKYIHGLYVQSVKDLPWNKISWAFIFRNATTWKLKIKDIFMFLGLYHY